MSPPRSLLILALSPVQSFIGGARKGSDLAFASWLLTHLTRCVGKAALEAGAEDEAEAVVPGADAINKAGSPIPNKLQLVLPAERVPAVVAAAERALREELKERMDAIFVKVGDKVHKAEALAQVLDLFELHHAALPLANDADYGPTLRRVEALLNAAKAHRAFAQPSWASERPKSSLDGARETVLRADVLKELRGDPERLWGTLRLRRGEQLCGPGLLKRWGPETLTPDEAEQVSGGHMPSTLHFASWNLRSRWQGPGADLDPTSLREAFSTYREALGAEDSSQNVRDPVIERVNPSLLYPGRLRDALAEHGSSTDPKDAARALSRLFRAWQAEAKERGKPPLPRPGVRYAVLQADGDHMGDAFARLDLHKARALSQALLDFAKQVRTIVENHHGQLIYAGGDDLLALLPVQTALDAARDVRGAFKAKVTERARELNAAAPTLSAGLAIAHMLQPIDLVLRDAQQAEQSAKQDHGRDALALHLAPRGGPPVQAGLKWDALDDLTHLVERYKADGDELPRGLPYDLRAIQERLPPHPQVDEAALGAVHRLELQRILAQKDLSPETQSTLLALVPEGAPALTALPRLVNLMLIARSLTLGEEDGE